MTLMRLGVAQPCKLVRRLRGVHPLSFLFFHGLCVLWGKALRPCPPSCLLRNLTQAVWHDFFPLPFSFHGLAIFLSLSKSPSPRTTATISYIYMSKTPG